jgi:hypothetical protein
MERIHALQRRYTEGTWVVELPANSPVFLQLTAKRSRIIGVTPCLPRGSLPFIIMAEHRMRIRSCYRWISRKSGRAWMLIGTWITDTPYGMGEGANGVGGSPGDGPNYLSDLRKSHLPFSGAALF